MTPKQFATLPRFAKMEIERLRSSLKWTQEQLVVLSSGQADDTRRFPFLTQTENFIGWRRINSHSISFNLSDSRETGLQMQMGHDGFMTVKSNRQLVIVPSASNCANLKSMDF